MGQVRSNFLNGDVEHEVGYVGSEPGEDRAMEASVREGLGQESMINSVKGRGKVKDEHRIQTLIYGSEKIISKFGDRCFG